MQEEEKYVAVKVDYDLAATKSKLPTISLHRSVKWEWESLEWIKDRYHRTTIQKQIKYSRKCLNYRGTSVEKCMKVY